MKTSHTSNGHHRGMSVSVVACPRNHFRYNSLTVPRRDGFGFSERSGRATEQVRLQLSASGSIENDRRHLFSTRHPEMPLGRTLVQLKDLGRKINIEEKTAA
jgi:hypothetical protein